MPNTETIFLMIKYMGYKLLNLPLSHYVIAKSIYIVFGQSKKNLQCNTHKLSSVIMQLTTMWC